MMAIVLGPVATTSGAGGFARCGLTPIDPWTASRVIRDFRIRQEINAQFGGEVLGEMV